MNKQVAESWEINNPGWKVHYIDFDNLKNYVSDIDYIYDTTKNITHQAKSDIIRLSLLHLLNIYPIHIYPYKTRVSSPYPSASL